MLRKNLGLSLSLSLASLFIPVLVMAQEVNRTGLSPVELSPGIGTATNSATPTLKEAVDLAPEPASDNAESGPDFNLFGNIGNNFLHTFKGGNLYLQLGAVAATAVLVPTDVDYNVEHYFNTHPQYTGWAHAVGYTGELLPFIVGGGLLAYAKLNHNDQVLGASFAVIQASLIAVV